MDKWHDLMDRLLKDDHVRKHKGKPIQLTNVAAGTQKRLLNNLKNRKDQRLTDFDSVRNLSRESSPVPLTEAEIKIRKKKAQLDRWKLERQQRKKVAAAAKKKPFLVGIVHTPLYFAPPPPMPRLQSATTGRVTRSQSAKSQSAKQNTETNQKNAKSFAPQNAVFHPPQMKTSTKITLAPVVTKAAENKEKVNSFKTTGVPKPKTTELLSFRPKQNAKMAIKPIVREVSSTKMTTRSNRLANVQSKIDTNIKAKTHDGDVMKKTIKVPNKVKRTAFTTVQRKDSPKRDIIKPKRQCTPGRPILTYRSSSDDKSTSSMSSQDGAAVDTISLEGLNTPKNKVPKSESSSEEKLKSPKDVNLTPESKISPCVVRSRGKDSARKEIKQKLNEGLIGEDMYSPESVHHLKQQLNAEITRMTEMCHTWDLILDQTELPNSIQERVLAAVGQARLLMSQKLQQFAGLVERCEAGEHHADGGLVTASDLQGFWDMVFIQVENIDLRFKELEALRQRGWVEEAPPEGNRKPAMGKALKKSSKPVVGIGATSRLKEMIAAARKAQQQPTDAAAAAAALAAPEPQKTFEGVFFSVRSPVRSPGPAPRTPRSSGAAGGLLRTVLSAEARRASATKSSASYAMLRASQISKNVEIEGISPLEQTPMNLTPINLKATPARSILKSTNTPKPPERKFTKTVLFDNYQDSESEGQDLNVTAESQLNITQTLTEGNYLKVNDGTRNADDVTSPSSPIKKVADDIIYNEETSEVGANKDVNHGTRNADDVTSPSSPIKKDADDVIYNEETSEVGANKDAKTNSRKKPLERQAAFDDESENANVAMTRRRGRRKSFTEMVEREDTPLPIRQTKRTSRRSSKKQKALQEIQVNVPDMEHSNDVATPKPVSRRRHKAVDDLDDTLKVTPRTSGRRKKAISNDDEFTADTLKVFTPRRSTRIRESVPV